MRSVVVLMDVLGYIDMTRKAEDEGRSQALLAELYEPLKVARGWLEDKNLILDNRSRHDRFVLRI